MNDMSSAAVAAPSANTFLYQRATVCQLLHLQVPETPELEVEPPVPGRFKMWMPNWNLIAVMNRAVESGLTIHEGGMHTRNKPFAKPTLPTGYLTMPFSPPRCGNERFRKPAQLKSYEKLASASALMMAILTRYLADLDLLYAGHWLITADRCGDKTFCIQVGDGALVFGLHDDRRINNADHGCAVVIN